MRLARKKQAALAACALALMALCARAETPSVPVAVGARFSEDGTGALLEFDLSRSVEASAYALDAPERIVIDLPEVNFHVDPAIGRISSAGPVRDFRFGLVASGRSRIVIDLREPVCPAAIESKPVAEGAPAARLKIELKTCDAASFAAIPRAETASQADAPAPAPAPPVIVLDPGHGGADGGAHGVGGIAEKSVVWDFCSELRRQLEATGRYKIVLTRDGDRYVDLEDRVDIGRNANAALFISVHADTLSEGGSVSASVSGSTVYTASERASDTEAARIAARENAADGGAKEAGRPEQDPGVTDILADLRRRETRAYAHLFSHALAGSLAGVARLNHNPERSARFVVLKAPEFPSVLVELGYLSNPQDLHALTSPEWRERTAAAMARAIDRFFASPGTGVAANETGAMHGNSPNH